GGGAPRGAAGTGQGGRRPRGRTGGRGKRRAPPAAKRSRHKKRRNRGAGQICLRDEAVSPAETDAGPVVGAVAARGENHDWRILELPELVGDVEAVDSRELHVEQNEVGLKIPGVLHSRLPVPGLADDVIALCLQERPGTGPKARVVVDDQNCHNHSLVPRIQRPNTVTHTLYLLDAPF